MLAAVAIGDELGFKLAVRTQSSTEAAAQADSLDSHICQAPWTEAGMV